MSIEQWGNGVLGAVLARRLEDFKLDGALPPGKFAELSQVYEEITRRVRLVEAREDYEAHRGSG